MGMQLQSPPILMLLPQLSIIMVWAMLTIIPIPMDILMSISNPLRRKQRERNVRLKAKLKLIPKLGITVITDMVDITDTPTDMVDTMDTLDMDIMDGANRCSS